MYVNLNLILYKLFKKMKIINLFIILGIFLICCNNPNGTEITHPIAENSYRVIYITPTPDVILFEWGFKSDGTVIQTNPQEINEYNYYFTNQFGESILNVKNNLKHWQFFLDKVNNGDWIATDVTNNQNIYIFKLL